MRRFIIKFSLFILLIGFVCFFLFTRDKNHNVKKFTTINNTFDVINLGTSHGNDFVYDGINGKAFNRASNTLYYDLQNYKYLKPYLNKSATIIIPLSYFSFGLDENRTDRGEENPFVNDFYLYLPKKSICSYTFQRKVDVYFNVVRSNFFKALPDLTFKNVIIKKESKLTKQEELVIHSIKRSKRHKRLGTFSNPNKNLKYLITLIEDAIENEYQPILVTPPYYESYNSGFEEQWLNLNYYKYIDSIIENTNIKYLDYSKDLRFTRQPEYYEDSDHLNTLGKKQFSKVFFNDLRILKLIKN